MAREDKRKGISFVSELKKLTSCSQSVVALAAQESSHSKDESSRAVYCVPLTETREWDAQSAVCGWSPQKVRKSLLFPIVFTTRAFPIDPSSPHLFRLLLLAMPINVFHSQFSFFNFLTFDILIYLYNIYIMLFLCFTQLFIASLIRINDSLGDNVEVDVICSVSNKMLFILILYV